MKNKLYTMDTLSNNKRTRNAYLSDLQEFSIIEQQKLLRGEMIQTGCNEYVFLSNIEKAQRNTPKQKQVRFRKRVKALAITLGVAAFTLAMGIVGENDRQTEMVEASYNANLVDIEDVHSDLVDIENIHSDLVEIETVSTRKADAVFVGYDEKGDTILRTEDGNEWAISDAPEVWYEIIFDTKGTDCVKDDEIIGLN